MKMWRTGEASGAELYRIPPPGGDPAVFIHPIHCTSLLFLSLIILSANKVHAARNQLRFSIYRLFLTAERIFCGSRGEKKDKGQFSSQSRHFLSEQKHN